VNDQELLRYSRHILLEAIGIEGQEAIRQARVLIVGLGGLGSAASLYLASAGVGTLLLADGDSVDLTNLQRQIVHRADRIGLPKVESARQTLQAIDPSVQIETLHLRLDDRALADAISQVDLVLDCCDNFATRHAINRACVTAGKPLVSGAAVRFDGQLAVFDPGSDFGCYHCLFPDTGHDDEERCATLGVFAPLVGVIGSLQAAEALKWLVGRRDGLIGRLQLYDGLSGRWHEIRLRRDPQCPVCGPA
jgi:adenylyltransferase/sulfurtransferase